MRTFLGITTMIFSAISLFLTSVFFILYLKSVKHIAGNHTLFLGIAFVLVMLGSVIYVSKGVIQVLLNCSMILVSYGTYGYFFATLFALSLYEQWWLPYVFTLLSLIFFYAIIRLKNYWNITVLVPTMTSLIEIIFWLLATSISGYFFYHKARRVLCSWIPYQFACSWTTLGEAAIFFVFFIICLLTQVLLLRMYKKSTEGTHDARQ